MDKPIYNYDPNNGLYLGQGEADPDPMQPDNYLIPAHAALDVPPIPGANEAVVRRLPNGNIPSGTDGAWVIVPDFRTVDLYSITDGSKVVVELGKTPAEMNATETLMPDNTSMWDGKAWVPDTVKLGVYARGMRNIRLVEADIAINKAEDVGQDATALRRYRQALRTWPDTNGFPDLSTLPVMP